MSYYDTLASSVCPSGRLSVCPSVSWFLRNGWGYSCQIFCRCSLHDRDGKIRFWWWKNNFQQFYGQKLRNFGLFDTNGYKHLLLWNCWAKFLDITQKCCSGDGIPRLFDWFRLDDFWPSYSHLNLVVAATYLAWAPWLQTTSSLKLLTHILKYHKGMVPRWWYSMVVRLVPLG